MVRFSIGRLEYYNVDDSRYYVFYEAPSRNAGRRANVFSVPLFGRILILINIQCDR